MNNIDENRRKVVQVLYSNEYEIDEVEGTILASKYCERGSGGMMCLMIESTPPFDEIKAWGDYATHSIDVDVSRMVNALNENLLELLGGNPEALVKPIRVSDALHIK